MTDMQQQNKQPTTSRIPAFKNRQEMAAWFDTHDLADYQDEFHTVEAKFAKNLSEGITVRLDPKTLLKLRKQASEKGVGPTTLVRMWVMEHLRTAAREQDRLVSHKK